MGFSIIGDRSAITQAINAFSAQYHEDYFRVRTHASSYLVEPLSLSSARGLAAPLLAALNSWGAGKRGAPSCSPIETAARALCEPGLHRRLKDLASSSQFLDLVDGRRALKHGAPLATVREFDRGLIEALHMLANALMVGNTNVTYPMKALLLITGLAPAYDSQVKGGLAIAGVSGVNKTRYLLPREDSADARKIVALPFLVADCVARSRSLLDAAIDDSVYPMLKGEYGRLFDVLLFIQRARTRPAVLLEFSGAVAGKWYDI
jgi:hypothetical protein